MSEVSMPSIQRSATDWGRLRRAATRLGTNAVRSAELANAAGSVIASRASLCLAGLYGPPEASQLELDRMIPEKITAVGAATAVLARRSGGMLQQIARFAADEAAIAARSATDLAQCRTPFEAFAVQSQWVTGWLARAVTQSISVGASVVDCQGAMLTPFHRAATGNATRLGV
jgi:hypothetical protein